MIVDARRDEMLCTYIEAHEFAVINVDDEGNVIVQIDKIDWDALFDRAWWVPTKASADRLAQSVPDGADADEAVRLIELTAERQSISLTPHLTMLERAARALVLIEERLIAMKATGKLRAMNSEYRDRRLYRAEKGLRTEPFAVWLHARKLQMIREIGAAAAGRKRPARTAA